MSNWGSSADLPPRPRQLMVAAGVVIGGSAILVAAAFDAIGNLQSVDARAELQRAISSSAGRDLGVTLDQATAAVRAALSVTAVCAAIAVVLGIYVLQRHRGARVGLTVVAVPLLLTAPLVGGFLGALVAVATLMLWNGPAGDWIAGRPVRTATGPAARGRSAPPTSDRPPSGSAAPPQAQSPSEPQPPPQTDAPSTRETSAAPGATEGFGTPVAEERLAAPLDQPVPPPGYAPGWPTSAADARPAPVRVACLVTWVFTGIVVLLYLFAVVALVVDRQAIVDRVVDSPTWRDAGLSDESLVPLLWLGVTMFLAWGVAAMVLAWFTWRRHDWARYLLVASAGLTLLVGFVAFPVGLVHQIACGVTIGALFSARSRAWFAGRPPSPPPGQHPGQHPGHQAGPQDGPQDGPPPGPPPPPRRPW